jgi:dTDP-4-dehydrorhamnose 3,5-epimerase
VTFEPTAVAGVWRVRAEPRHDGRGSFARLFDAAAIAVVALGFVVRQVNHSVTRRRGTVRGLHLQLAPAGEGAAGVCVEHDGSAAGAREWKLVRCLRGRAYDVAADLRAGSPTFGRHVALTLDAHAGDALLIAPGVAHGFQALTDDVQLLYHHGDDHRPELEAGVRHDDPALAIAWPLPVALLSERDRRLPGLDAFRERAAA